jgi:hypothetical protein
MRPVGRGRCPESVPARVTNAVAPLFKPSGWIYARRMTRVGEQVSRRL